jgi:hypothetical protein
MSQKLKSPGPLVFVRVGGEEVKIEGRAARLVRWLAERQAEINGLDRGQIHVDFAGRSLRGYVQRPFEVE